MPDDLNSREAIEKHLDLIQSVITRMAQNSFIVKGWSWTVITAITAFWASSDNFSIYVGLLILPLLSFWILDAYFLQQERGFRNAYKRIVAEIGTPESQTIKRYEIVFVEDAKTTLFRSFWSISMSLFHGPLLVLVGAAAFFAYRAPTEPPGPSQHEVVLKEGVIIVTTPPDPVARSEDADQSGEESGDEQGSRPQQVPAD